MRPVYVLWDASQLWGLMVVRALRCLGVAHRPVRAAEVAAGLLQREPARLLIVPGGPAGQKAEALGKAGLEAVRAFVGAGGNYLGFCGGAGLALSASGGLNLCPWKRAGFSERLQHFMSGHMNVRLDHRAAPDLLPPGMGETAALPVWWPGRFEPVRDGDVAVPAAFIGPGKDFCLADLAVADLPPDTFEVWKDLYGFSPTPSFLGGSPCMAAGVYGLGRYVLSYSHLETPESPDAGRIFSHLLRLLGDCRPAGEAVPVWEFPSNPPESAHSLPARLWAICAPIFELGSRHGLLFSRTSWLLGWRTGIPGAALNSLRAALACACEAPLTPAAVAFAETHAAAMLAAAGPFATGCAEYLLTERLAQTLTKALPDTLPNRLLGAKREALFGPPMHPGGPFADLTGPLDELVFLQYREFTPG